MRMGTASLRRNNSFASTRSSFVDYLNNIPRYIQYQDCHTATPNLPRSQMNLNNMNWPDHNGYILCFELSLWCIGVGEGNAGENIFGSLKLMEEVYSLDYSLSLLQFKQMHQNIVTILFPLLLSLLLPQTNSLTTIPAFQITNKYIETGTYTLNTAGYFYGNASWAGTQSTQFNIPYLSAHSSYRAIISIQQMSFEVTAFHDLNTTITRCGYFTAYLLTCLDSNTLNNLQVLRARYIVLQAAFSKLSLYNLFIFSNSSINITPAIPYVNNYGLPAYNVSGTVRVFLAFSGFNITTNANREFDIKALGSFLTSTTLQIKIETTSTNGISLKGATLVFIGFNQYVVGSWPFPSAQLNFASFAGNSGAIAVYVDANNISRSFNTFWGLNRLNIRGQSKVSFNSELTQNTDIRGTSNYASSDLWFSVLIFLFKECNSTTPYYLIANDTCYDTCPSNYYQDNTQYLCVKCTYYDCESCSSNGSCTACSNSTHFRVLNTATNRCDPMIGYYDDGSNSSLCLPCDSNCKTCQLSATTCTSCANNSYLDTTLKKCFPCLNECLSCNGTNSSCLSCGNQRILINSSCLLCSTLLGIGCDSCNFFNSTLTCVNCSGGTIINGSCQAWVLQNIQSDNKLSRLLLLILLPVLLSLGCCCCLIFFIWRRRKHEQNKIEEQFQENRRNLDIKAYKGDSLKMQGRNGKIQPNITQQNELSNNEFKDKQLSDIKVETKRQKIHQKSEINDHEDISISSEFSRSGRERSEEQRESQSRGGAY